MGFQGENMNSSVNYMRSNNKGGFTLAEVLIATAIMSVLIGSILTLAWQSVRFQFEMRRTARSSQILQQKLEDIRLLTWSSLQSFPSTFATNDPLATYSGTIATSSYDSYGGQTTVETVTLTVTWTNQAGRVLNNSLSTLISNGGLNTYFY